MILSFSDIAKRVTWIDSMAMIWLHKHGVRKVLRGFRDQRCTFSSVDSIFSMPCRLVFCVFFQSLMYLTALKVKLWSCLHVYFKSHDDCCSDFIKSACYFPRSLCRSFYCPVYHFTLPAWLGEQRAIFIASLSIWDTFNSCYDFLLYRGLFLLYFAKNKAA